MKQNNEELQDFLRDLDSWETDIKTRDERLKEDTADDKREVKCFCLVLCEKFCN